MRIRIFVYFAFNMNFLIGWISVMKFIFGASAVFSVQTWLKIQQNESEQQVKRCFNPFCEHKCRTAILALPDEKCKVSHN